ARGSSFRARCSRRIARSQVAAARVGAVEAPRLAPGAGSLLFPPKPAARARAVLEEPAAQAERPPAVPCSTAVPRRCRDPPTRSCGTWQTGARGARAGRAASAKVATAASAPPQPAEMEPLREWVGRAVREWAKMETMAAGAATALAVVSI